MANKVLYIRYKDNQETEISSHIDAQKVQRDFALEDVADLIAAYRPGSLLAETPIELIILHSAIDGVEGPALRPGLSLSEIACGQTDANPLIIKSRNNVEVAFSAHKSG
ncbi:hypothetical protein HK100_008338, partial [Physocladia obscura]